MRQDIERLRQDSTWLRRELDQLGQRLETANATRHQQLVEAFEREKQSLVHHMEIRERMMTKLHQEELNRNRMTVTQRNPTIKKSKRRDAKNTIAQQISTIKEPKQEQPRDNTDVIAEKVSAIENLEDSQHSGDQPAGDGSSDPPEPRFEHHTQAGSDKLRNQDEDLKNTTLSMAKSAKNSPISLDGTSEEPKESTRAVAPPSGSLCHLELSGGSPFEASKYTPGPNKAQAAKTFPKSFAEVAREAENSTGPRTPPSTSQKINKTVTHHPQSPHMASSELGKNSRPRTAGPSFHQNSKFGTQGYPRNSLNETEQLSHVSPTPLDEVLKVVDPNKDNAAGHSSNSPQQTERLSDVPRDAQDMVEEGSVDPEALTSGRDVQHGAVRPSSGPGTPPAVAQQNTGP
jgi:hypothetical protein